MYWLSDCGWLSSATATAKQIRWLSGVVAGVML